MNYSKLRPSGVLDGAGAIKIRNDIRDMVSDGSSIILVDLQEVTFVNSSAIGALVATLKLVQGSGGKLFLCALNEQIKLIFELTRMDKIFTIYTDQNAFEKAVVATV